MKNKLIRILMSIQIIILPILDMLRTTNFRKIELCGIAIIELVNILLIGCGLLLTIIKLFKNKNIKMLVGLFIYLGLFLIYTYYHCMHIKGFNIEIYSLFSYNFLVEVFYMGRVYLMPLMLLFILFNNRDILDKKFYMTNFKIVICIISFSIIILDLFKISYISYGETGTFISHNFLDYFLYSGDWKQLTARGWFDSANELSAIMLMLLPINIYILFKETTRFNYIMFFCQFFAMILLGTRTAAVGSVLICVVIAICYLIITFIKKFPVDKKVCGNYIVIVFACTAYMLISPFMFGKLDDANASFSSGSGISSDIMDSITEIDEESTSSDIDVVNCLFYDRYKVNKTFLEIYPLYNDIEFWSMVASRDLSINNNSRVMKIDIIKRIMERNNNKMDKYLGMGYSLNFIDLERDYIYQYYLFGILGLMLFIMPYFIILLICLGKFLLNIHKGLKIVTIVSFMMPMLGLMIAYFSGHVFGWVSPMMFLNYCMGFMLYNIFLRRKENEE